MELQEQQFFFFAVVDDGEVPSTSKHPQQPIRSVLSEQPSFSLLQSGQLPDTIVGKEK